MTNVTLSNGIFVVKVEFWDNERAKSIPKRTWDKVAKVWLAPSTKPNAMYLRKEFESHEIEPEAMAQIDRLDQRIEYIPFPKDYEFVSPPMAHQADALDLAWGLDQFAFFFDMRLGKTFTALNLARARYHFKQVERLLVICPTPIKTVWELEIDNWFFPDETDVFTMESGQQKQAISWMFGHDNEHLQILIVGVESLSQGGAYSVARQFCLGGVPTMMVIDESSRIKNYKSARTEKCIQLGGRCDYRAILTGTPVTQGMHDLYSQFEFLHKDIIGQKSFFTFRNRYMVMGGFEGRQIMGYRNAAELMELIEPYCSIVKKGDVYDLPTLPPQTRNISPSPEQKKHFIELKHLMKTTYGEEELEARTMLERMTRFQQINGGNFPHPAKEKDNKGNTIWVTTPLKSNPKLAELEMLIDEVGDSPTIIWARFVPEIEAIVQMLQNKGKDPAVFYGATSKEDRKTEVARFQEGSAQFFVGNQATGGMGIKLSAADIMIYYSNTFSYEDRQQSKARAEEIGMKTGVLYIDLVLNTVIDRAIMLAQKKKGGMAAYVDGHLKDLKKELQ